MMSTEDYIRRTFELARLGLGKTWPNPLVGAVIVKGERIIGEGFHRQHGGPHAEVEALENCSESPEGATIYVSLEPCCHTHKLTPPCAQRLVKEKIKKVVIANLDPNPSVNGQGVELLRAHGLEVETHILAVEGERLNEVFFHAQRTKTPFVQLKLATSLDGRIALPSGESQWITGEKAREMVHQMRAHHQAIMAGAETVRKDNPRLTVRLENYTGKQPLRVVFTQSGNLPPESHLFHDGLETIIYSPRKLPQLPSVQVQNLTEAMQDLFEKKLIALMLEGGASLSSSFLRAGLIHRVSLFMNPSLLGAGPGAIADFGLTQLSNRPTLQHIESRWIENDLYLSGRLK